MSSINEQLSEAKVTKGSSLKFVVHSLSLILFLDVLSNINIDMYNTCSVIVTMSCLDTKVT